MGYGANDTFSDDAARERLAACPAEPCERISRAITAPVKLRGWYLEGDGIGDARYGRWRALAILVVGCTIETTVAHDRAARCTPVRRDGPVHAADPSGGGTEKWGARPWRGYLHAFNRAGLTC